MQICVSHGVIGRVSARRWRDVAQSKSPRLDAPSISPCQDQILRARQGGGMQRVCALRPLKAATSDWMWGRTGGEDRKQHALECQSRGCARPSAMPSLLKPLCHYHHHYHHFHRRHHHRDHDSLSSSSSPFCGSAWPSGVHCAGRRGACCYHGPEGHPGAQRSLRLPEASSRRRCLRTLRGNAWW